VQISKIPVGAVVLDRLPATGTVAPTGFRLRLRVRIVDVRINVLGIGFDDVAMAQAVTRAFELIQCGSKAYAVTPNPEIVWQCRKNETLRAAIDGAGLVLPDGIGIIIGAKILGTPLRGGRVPGIDFAAALFEKMAEAGGSVFLLGAKPGVAAEAGVKLTGRFPGLVIAGAADGYFSEDSQVIERINAANPDLLLVCLGAPKQEFWMADNCGRLSARLSVGLGGALDVFAGKVNRAPVFFQKTGLEWLHRLICDPRRIKRMIKLPLFLFAVCWKRIGPGRKRDRG